MLKPYNYTGTDKGAVLTKKLLETFAGVGGNKKDKKDIIVHFSETKIKKLIVEILNVPGINGNLNNCDTAFTPEDFGKLFDDLYNKISCPLDTDI